MSSSVPMVNSCSNCTHSGAIEQHMAKGGVYVVLMQLLVETTIAVGRLGTFTFPAGWHTYIGSAHGGGGVAARVGRHLRLLGDGKNARWNIDYLRDHTDVHEVWFSHAPATRECEWVETIHTAMPGATIPAKDFGAHCQMRCKAHLFRFDDRPRFADFQSAVLSRWPGHESIHRKMVEPSALRPMISRRDTYRRLMAESAVGFTRAGRRLLLVSASVILRVE